MAVDYDSWRISSPYDDYTPTHEDDGYFHKDDLPDFDDCEDFLKGIIEAIYVTGNVDDLENYLDKLSAQFVNQFNIKLPESEPILEKKNKNRLMDWYLGYQRAHIDHMKYTERNYV
jgi:uncharacterized protein (DUF1499 family)